MVGGEKDKDSVSFFRLQLAARGIYIINPWTPGILNEKVSFPLSIMTSVLSLSYSLCHGHCEWFLSSFLSSPTAGSPQHTFRQSTRMWNSTSFPAFAVLIKSSGCLVTLRQHSQHWTRFPKARHIQPTYQPPSTLCQTLKESRP